MTVAGEPAVSYAYDDADRLTSITRGSLVVGFDHDAAGRRTKTTLPNGITQTYSHDAASNVTRIDYASALGALSYDYDAAGRRIGLGGSLAKRMWQPVVLFSVRKPGFESP